MFCIWNFNNLTCIFLARVIEHLSIRRSSIPSLRRNGGSLLWVNSPLVCHPTFFLHFISTHVLGCVQEVEGLFWRVRCNTKLKKQASINLHGYFKTLTQWILRWVKTKKCRKLNEISKYIYFFYWKCWWLYKVRYFLTGTFYFWDKL